jgi:hypothetical protein
MQLWFRGNHQVVEWKSCKSAEALATSLFTNGNGKQGDSCRLQLGQYLNQGLGVFEAVEIPELG